uniref:Uncharacterized protein n=1 Tax=Rhizophora mucronata TaxID=61149 RepID=A0A2P2ITJ3_RHIMU
MSDPEYPSVRLHMVLTLSVESLNNPSFSKRLRTIQALASNEGRGI